ncbi:type II toxin-antitoxin system RelE/ParE family toxin [Mesorhizobium sp. LHD-90]|uniref:type II toxin-antitoxin system RelE/ParE family toxin n=1 Tax=Mesorhizobium sp. LHD-90 TaxID=3071414 RepID=UPI0027E0C787|nr:type II toxin-antitoxin system RelE/ParE family toxin [Mesorhizobium sp. LHD-90]MDQ6435997.1 type II toxin-antitoxin system RelE/ParE family toxin [Mesorhizobium sp. LHD-90]
MLVRWLPRALAERNAQLAYIAKDSLRAAIEQGDRIQTAANRLTDFPELGRPGRRRGTRELVITGTSFLAVYRIRAKAAEVQILRLLHGAQR